MFHSLLSISSFIFFNVLFMLSFSFKTKLCFVSVLCFFYMFPFYVSFLCFPFCVWLKLLYGFLLCFCNVWYVDLICFLLCKQCLRFVLQPCFCLIMGYVLCWILICCLLCFCSRICQLSRLLSWYVCNWCPKFVGDTCFTHVSTTSIVQSKKTSWTHNYREIKEIALATGFSQLRIRASKIFRPPVPWCKFSAQ